MRRRKLSAASLIAREDNWLAWWRAASFTLGSQCNYTKCNLPASHSRPIAMTPINQRRPNVTRQAIRERNPGRMSKQGVDYMIQIWRRAIRAARSTLWETNNEIAGPV